MSKQFSEFIAMASDVAVGIAENEIVVIIYL